MYRVYGLYKADINAMRGLMHKGRWSHDAAMEWLRDLYISRKNAS
ncbi:hypothetical protein FNPHOIGM_00036 [Dickeya phage DchS19]|uniref:Uncharacterized protein n=1 Tax=Dickeya phage DchS19 TaxID=2951194 RepID=A0A9E7LUW9_9CAUD|nr:hypothetical protein FNPHOIGM_00036 [Dickeya phage DchS19]